MHKLAWKSRVVVPTWTDDCLLFRIGCGNSKYSRIVKLGYVSKTDLFQLLTSGFEFDHEAYVLNARTI